MVNAERLQGEAPMDSTPSAPAKVLIVDDLEEARWVLSNLIQLAGFAPGAGAGGGGGLAHIRPEGPARGPTTRWPSPSAMRISSSPCVVRSTKRRCEDRFGNFTIGRDTPALCWTLWGRARPFSAS